MNKQEIFDTVVAHARLQNEKSVHPKDPNYCMYRNQNGRKCFIGCLITDGMYEFSMEGKKIMADELIGVRNRIGAKNDDVRFLESLQEIHDIHSILEWETRFKDLAAHHNLLYK